MVCENMLFGDKLYCKKDNTLKPCTQCIVDTPEKKYNLEELDVKPIEDVYYHSSCGAEMRSIEVGLVQLEKNGDHVVCLPTRQELHHSFKSKIIIGYICPFCGLKLDLIKGENDV